MPLANVNQRVSKAPHCYNSSSTTQIFACARFSQGAADAEVMRLERPVSAALHLPALVGSSRNCAHPPHKVAPSLPCVSVMPSGEHKQFTPAKDLAPSRIAKAPFMLLNH